MNNQTLSKYPHSEINACVFFPHVHVYEPRPFVRVPETCYNAAFPRFPSNTIYDPLPEQMGCELPFLLNVNISKTNYGNASERCFCANENTTGSLYDFIRLVKALFCYGVASLSLCHPVSLSLSPCKLKNKHTHTYM